MQFLNDTSIEQLITHGADVFTVQPSGVSTQVPMCHVFMKDNSPWIDFIPALPRKYTLPIPEDAIISRNEVELSVGRYAIIVTGESVVGQTVINFAATQKK